MVRKGSNQKNGIERNRSHRKFSVSDSVGAAVQEKKHKGNTHEENIVNGEEVANASHQCRPNSLTRDKLKAKNAGDRKKNSQNLAKATSEDHVGVDVMGMADSGDDVGNEQTSNPTEARGSDGVTLGSSPSSKILSSSDGTQHGLPDKDITNGSGFSAAMAVMNLKASALFILKVVSLWLERQKPHFEALMTTLFKVQDYVRLRTEHAYPIIWMWISHLGKLGVLLAMVWLDCSLRGVDSLLRLGTTSFFTVIWCSILSVIAMVIAGLMALFVGFTLAILVVFVFTTIFLWLYGSFWTTGLVIVVGGISFALSHERLALLITTIYSIYSARGYVGWLGVLLGMNLSFISSDILIYFLKNNRNEHNRPDFHPEQSAETRSFFQGEPMHASQPEDASHGAFGRSVDHNPEPSTSGTEAELTSEDEVIRLLNCKDHYSALGFARYENIDVSLLKREYRKKAMLVHPDKNMGNEKAAEAFKKLQNAYEVLLDSLKRKAYDDELRREELLNYFRRFQSSSQKITDLGCKWVLWKSFWTVSAPSKDVGNLAIYIRIYLANMRDCKDFHPAKDGDGWVEQSFQPLLFGLLQKVEAPCAYVCAESRIYDATEWFICQGMRCPANSHKPSFHVNTTVTSKHSNVKGTGTGHRAGGMPTTNMDESMTEEEFFEWLQNAVQSGLFETNGSSAESPTAKAGSSSKSGSSSSKKKKKGKKQW
ncbi:hypothetical protein ACLOJK_026610 [Asimina triloba]